MESGLNDGICVPIVLILLGLAVGTQLEGRPIAYMVRVVAEEIGIGLAVGLLLTAAAVGMLELARRYSWLSRHWLEIPIVALAAACSKTECCSWRSRSTTPPPGPPPSMNIASGRYCWAISATLAATVMVSAPVNLIHETLRASRPRRSTITLRSSPNRATSTLS